MKPVYVVNWGDEATYVYTSEDAAIKQVEEITGTEREKWSFDNGDIDNYGRSVGYRKAEYYNEND